MPASRSHGMDQDFYPWSPIVARPILRCPNHARVAQRDGCGGREGKGREGKVELLTGIEGASSRPVRRIVLIDGLGYVMPATRRESTSQLTSSWRNAVVFTKGR
jgi:hypothetical protein